MAAMKYNECFAMSKYSSTKDMLRSKVSYLESQLQQTLQRLHMAKRRNREDKVKLNNVIECHKEYAEIQQQYIDLLLQQQQED